MTLSMEDTLPMLPQRIARRPSGRVAQSTPSHSYRTSPYSLDGTRSRSTSVASQSLPRTRCASPLSFANDDFIFQDSASSASVSSSMISDGIVSHDIGNLDTLFDDRSFVAQQYPYSHDNVFLPAAFESLPYRNGPSSILASSATFDLTHGRGQSEHNCDTHYGDLAEPPNLFGPLEEDQLCPPPEDMNPDDPDMIPRKQELRFEGDLYTPRYVRGHGNKREGWCGICKPGRWLVLKNSAFWYDKSFSHGISAATGTAFDGPKETRRMNGNPDVWEGLCGSCGDWIALISSKKKGTTWFRHAYKCHTHQKVKDTPKRRREGNQSRTSKAAKNFKSQDRSPERPDDATTELSEDSGLARTASALQSITAMI